MIGPFGSTGTAPMVLAGSPFSKSRQRSAVLIKGDHRAVTVELLAQGNVVGMHRPDDGGGGVDLFTESVALGGRRREPESKFGQLFVATCLDGRAAASGGRVGCPTRPGRGPRGALGEAAAMPVTGLVRSMSRKPAGARAGGDPASQSKPGAAQASYAGCAQPPAALLARVARLTR
jgi:hypothetical protein